ncbi:hypothetical protein CRM22_006540 [Opisthorchis felineus]|uniref:Polyprenyl synthetase n=1 Tax=Opisthorchis felineus TaxID=147828 RepID=A0A4S2LSP9_OPIFE|nr:hypothetical protein CRM22_006540 [Opisthorchis felineus]
MGKHLARSLLKSTHNSPSANTSLRCCSANQPTMEACSLPSCSPGVVTMDTNRWIQLQKEFDAYYSEFERLLSECVRPENSADELVQIARYNLAGGKRVRGCLVAASLEAFIGDNVPDRAALYRAYIVGWCIEMLHAGFLIHDDIIDNSPARRNRTSWFLVQRQAGRGLIAVNDGLHLILTTKFLLHHLFTRSGTTTVGYHKLLRLFDEVSYRTCWGESLDSEYSRTAPNDNTTELLPLDSFTRSNFNEICTWKTGFYTFYLPVACGMAIDDYLDCFGDVAVTGKVGTDIADGKCSWPIVECLARASPEQIKVIQQNYGRRDPVAQSAVRKVYEQLRLPQIFADYETQMRTEIIGDITDWTLSDACVTRHAQHLFCYLVDLLFRRTK